MVAATIPAARMATKSEPEIQIRPQPGAQEKFLSTPADIAIYGGAAGAGKTFAILIENLRHIANPDFGSVIFRRETTQITNEGGLWDTASQIYPFCSGVPKLSPRHQYTFSTGARITFSHLHLEADVHSWQGAQIPLICFDELTHFSKYQFFYMLSRNRSTCGVKPYIRATTNPDADSWVATFIDWWIDKETGYPIPERSGVLRWFVRSYDAIVWADSPEELAAQGYDPNEAKSVTFIAASIYDNPALLSADPGYLNNLKALSRVERERLLAGNWKIKPAAGLYFNRNEATVIESVPADVVSWVRAWDLAATEITEDNPNPDFTAGVKMGKRANGRFVVAHVERFRKKASDVRATIKRTATHDTKRTMVSIPVDPGQAGKEQSQSYVTMLAGYSVKQRKISGDKLTRVEPFASQWQAGNVDVVRGAWNDEFFGELESFPDPGSHDDQVDAAGDAFNGLINGLPQTNAFRVAGL
jgi:predicted phage terminase large subunit-like protein